MNIFLNTYSHIEIKRDPVEGLYVEIPDESNIMVWDIWMEGPPDSPLCVFLILFTFEIKLII